MDHLGGMVFITATVFFFQILSSRFSVVNASGEKGFSGGRIWP
jgi:hypothetical protein